MKVGECKICGAAVEVVFGEYLERNDHFISVFPGCRHIEFRSIDLKVKKTEEETSKV